MSSSLLSFHELNQEINFEWPIKFCFCCRLDVITESEDQQSFVGKRLLVSFLSWLDYCDQLIGVANPYVAKALSRSIRETFLDVIMEPSLLQASESGAVLSTTYLTRCLRTVCSPPLLAGRILWHFKWIQILY